MGTARKSTPATRWLGLVTTSMEQVAVPDEAAAECAELDDVIAKAAVGVDRVGRAAHAARRALGRLHAEAEVRDAQQVGASVAAVPADGRRVRSATGSPARLDIIR